VTAKATEVPSVTPLELSFDLVFVFAPTRVTGFLADHLTCPSLVTLVVLAMLLCALAAFETIRSREFRRAPYTTIISHLRLIHLIA
jgi:low temperature requirement protein LtrA